MDDQNLTDFSVKGYGTNDETELESSLERFRCSRERSPMQQKLIREQKWQKILVELDEYLSNFTNQKNRQFNQELFEKAFHDKIALSKNDKTLSSFASVLKQMDRVTLLDCDHRLGPIRQHKHNERYTTTLSLLFKLFDSCGFGKFKQEKLIDCARVALQNRGGRDWVELLEVLAFAVCEENDVTEESFIKIFTSKGVVAKLFKHVNKENDNFATQQEVVDFIALLTSARSQKEFDDEDLHRLEKVFQQALGSKNELSIDDFQKIVHSKNAFFSQRAFEIFDRDKNGSISMAEFLDAVQQFTGRSSDDKIKFLFKIYDLDGDGLIQREELEEVMKACMEENGMKFSHEQIEDLTLALFEDADTEERGAITYEALKAQLEKHSGLLENLSMSIDRWLVPPVEKVQRKSLLEKLKSLIPYQLTTTYFKNNYVYVLFLLFYIGVNLGLFIDRALFIANTAVELNNVYYILARACGHALNFNCAFIVVLMLRNSLTFLRERGFADFLPIDHHIYFHKLCGFVIFFYSTLHTVMHCIHFPLVVVHIQKINVHNLSAAQWLLTAEPGVFGLVPGWANPTGFILMVILIVMVICSLPFVRRSGYFEIFYWTHLLYVPFFVLTILHGPHFWKWFVVPGTLFVAEKIFRSLRTLSGHGKTYISSGILLPSQVTHLVVKKPSGFHYRCGDYLFVNIPSIAKYEWHPFTISSAPEQEDFLWLHIRGVGEWTYALYAYFEDQQKRSTSSHQFYDKTLSIKRKTSQKKQERIKYLNEKSGESSRDLSQVTKDHEQKSPPSKKFNEDNAGDQQIPSKSTTTEDNLNTAQQNNSFCENGGYVDDLEGNDLSPSDQLAFPVDSSAEMSLRYMRRRPRVITLYTPDDSELADPTQAESDKSVQDEESFRFNASIKRLRRKLSSSSSKASSVKYRHALPKPDRTSRVRDSSVPSIGKPLAIYMDGPYGAPSSHIFRAQHAVLIGTGIGVTPFASILQSIMHRYLKARQTCPKCAFSWNSELPNTVMHLKKVDFIWINRDQRSFEWFLNLLSQLEIEQAEHGGSLDRFLDMHMYITSALQRTDMKAVGLQLALELLHEKEKTDLVTGLKTRTNAGRPNWDKVFTQLRNQNKGKVTVFYCGPPQLGRFLRHKCGEYNFNYKKESF